MSYAAEVGPCAAEVGHTGGVIPVLRASLVAVALAGVLVASGCSAAPFGCRPGASCSFHPPFELTFGMTVNGQFASFSGEGNWPSYSVRAGQPLVINVAVSVPRRTTVSELWRGISTGNFGGDSNGPTGVNPILVRTRVLTAGLHSFRLQWRTPAEVRGSSLYLVADWASQPPTFDTVQLIAELVPR